MARNVLFDFLRGGGSSLEILYGEVTLTPTQMHSVGTSAVLPAPTKFDLIAGKATATNVAPSPDPVDGQVPWAYKVCVRDRHGKQFEYLVGVPDGVPPINFVDLPTYFETKPPAWGIGPAGPSGQAATVAVGTVSNGPAPSVVNSGTSVNAVLDFTLQKGDKGDTGATGVGIPAGGTALQFVRKDSANTTTEWVTVDKALVGLGSVDNTADADKPVSTAQQEAIDTAFNGTDTKVSGLISNPASATYASLIGLFPLKNTLTFNVRDFGAAGDGVTDDTASFQAAADGAFAKGGGIVIVPAGTYLMQSYARLRSHTIVLGVGNPTITVTGSGTTAKFAILSNGSVGYGSGAENVMLMGLTFQGNFAAGRGIGALAANHGSNIVVQSCKFIEAHRFGHIFDLQGCDVVKFRDCDFIGADYSASTANLTSEAIQLDASARTGASVLDAAGSYDGLPTRNVTVDNCRFLPLTVGGTTYPCPNPIGSHFMVEGMWYSKIVFSNNVVEHPAEDIVNGLRGTLHFTAVKGLRVLSNTFKGLDTRSQRVIAGYPLTTAFAVAGVDTAGQSSTALSIPATCYDILVDGNTYEGFGTDSTVNEIIYMTGQNTSGMISDVKVVNNTFRGCYPPLADSNVGSHLFVPRFARSALFEGNYADRSRRMVFYSTAYNLKIVNNYNGFGGGAGDVNGVNGVDIITEGNTFLNTGLAVFYSATSSGKILNNTVTTRMDVARILDVSGTTRFQIIGNDVTSTNSVDDGIAARSTSTVGLITNNIVTGVTNKVTVDGTSSATQANNI